MIIPVRYKYLTFYRDIRSETFSGIISPFPSGHG